MNETLAIDRMRYHPPGIDWQLAVDRMRVHAGEMVGVIGPNGAGKSTLARIAAGILAPDEGAVRLKDTDITSLGRREIARILGYLPQHTAGGDHLTVRQIVALGRYPHLGGGFLSAGDTAVIERCLGLTETASLSNRVFGHLSGGERQRVLLASILAQEPSVLILDEPGSALDLHHTARFHSLLNDLAGNGLSVVAVTHDINTAAAFCGRLIVMRDGVLIADGGPDDVLTPKTVAELYGDEVGVTVNPHTGSKSVYLTRARNKGAGDAT